MEEEEWGNHKQLIKAFDQRNEKAGLVSDSHNSSNKSIYGNLYHPSCAFKESTKRTLVVNRINVEIAWGDIFEDLSQAVVVPVDTQATLLGGGPLSERAANLGGGLFQRKVANWVLKHKRLSAGNVAAVPAKFNKLKQDYIILVTPGFNPIATFQPNERSDRILSEVIKNCLTTACRLGLETISLPALGCISLSRNMEHPHFKSTHLPESSAYGYPVGRCAKVCMDAVNTFLTNSLVENQSFTLKTVRFTLLHERTYEEFIRHMVPQDEVNVVQVDPFQGVEEGSSSSSDSEDAHLGKGRKHQPMAVRLRRGKLIDEQKRVVRELARKQRKHQFQVCVKVVGEQWLASCSGTTADVTGANCLSAGLALDAAQLASCSTLTCKSSSMTGIVNWGSSDLFNVPNHHDLQQLLSRVGMLHHPEHSSNSSNSSSSSSSSSNNRPTRRMSDGTAARLFMNRAKFKKLHKDHCEALHLVTGFPVDITPALMQHCYSLQARYSRFPFFPASSVQQMEVPSVLLKANSSTPVTKRLLTRSVGRLTRVDAGRVVSITTWGRGRWRRGKDLAQAFELVCAFCLSRGLELDTSRPMWQVSWQADSNQIVPRSFEPAEFQQRAVDISAPNHDVEALGPRLVEQQQRQIKQKQKEEQERLLEEAKREKAKRKGGAMSAAERRRAFLQRQKKALSDENQQYEKGFEPEFFSVRPGPIGGDKKVRWRTERFWYVFEKSPLEEIRHKVLTSGEKK